MTAPVVFDTCLELLPWGRNVYTIIKIPEELADLARRERTRRVDGTIEDQPVNLGLNRTDVLPETFVYVGAPLQRRLGARAGDPVRCTLAPADPDAVPVPDDVDAALDAAGLRDAFEGRPPAERRRMLVPVNAATRPDTRARRIAHLVDGLEPGR